MRDYSFNIRKKMEKFSNESLALPFAIDLKREAYKLSILGGGEITDW